MRFKYNQNEKPLQHPSFQIRFRIPINLSPFKFCSPCAPSPKPFLLYKINLFAESNSRKKIKTPANADVNCDVVWLLQKKNI
ncbi:hypothetical protein EYC84_003610 [Monilinia fructicola]|uniref:Uncharacterized protein n=1 Tax=Monilinia fructicola TaxID=38448 RepID=A0A5M9JY44_MONFR|nr:hypothetical protein EYC84_003610 [Monilinia fructicola]